MNATAPIELDELRLVRGGATSPKRDERADRRARLAPVSAPEGARKSPVLGAIIAVCVILGIFAAQLTLSILVSQGAYEKRALEVEQRDLARVERVLSQNLDKLASPQNLAENATALGMVQNVHPATMRLSDGVIQGTLDSTTRAAAPNLIANSQLEDLPIVDAQGLMQSRETSAPEDIDVTAAVRWQGKLPAPTTH